MLPRPRTLLALLTFGAAACRAERVAPASSEFLLLAGDSTFWVRTGSQGVRVRGSPIQLARFGGRFHELYVTDDDRSFQDAVFVGQRVYRRDLITGDSLLLFEDTTIAGLAAWYARQHPDSRRLGPQEEASEEPHVAVTSDVALLDHHGPYLSYEYDAEATVGDDEEWRLARRGVVDLRTGHPVTVGEVFGDAAGRRALARGAALFSQALDSVLASQDHRAGEAAAALADFEFDGSSFAIVELGDGPAVEFMASGKGRSGGLTLTLPLVALPAPPWWKEVREALPASRPGQAGRRWARRDYEIVARDAADGEGASLALLDSAGRQWPIARVPTPVWRLYWLDDAADTETRRALARAFDEASLYSEETRTAALRPRRPVGRDRMTLTSG